MTRCINYENMEQCVRLEAQQLPEYYRDTQLKTFLLLINKHSLSTDSCEAISICKEYCSVLGTESANGSPLSFIHYFSFAHAIGFN